MDTNDSIAQLKIIRMESCSCESNDIDVISKGGKFELKLEDTSLLMPENEHESEGGRFDFFVLVTFNLRGFAADADPSEADSIFTIKYVVRAGYKLPDGIEMDRDSQDENMPGYLNQIYTATRDPISYLLSQMGLSALVLPWEMGF